MTALERLNLSDNQIADLWPLAGLGLLHRLDLSGSAVVDASALNLAGGDPITDLWPLAGDLSGSAVVDASAAGESAGCGSPRKRHGRRAVSAGKAGDAGRGHVSAPACGMTVARAAAVGGARRRWAPRGDGPSADAASRGEPAAGA